MDLINQFLKSASLGNLAEVEEFLKCGCSVDCQDNEGTSPLQVASANGADRIVFHLLSENASVDLPNRSGWTPLMLAARSGHTSIIIHLIKSYAKINIYNNMGLTPLIAAVCSGNVSTVKVLLENGAITDHLTSTKAIYHFDVTPLMMAALLGYQSMVHLLLDAGASVDCISTAIGWSPLMFASCNSHKHIVQILNDAGANETKTNILDQSASDIATQISQRAVKDSLENVWTKKVDIVPKEEKILTAVRNGNLDEVKSIISDNPISVNYVNPKNMVSILMVAATYGHSDIVKVLIQNGSDLDTQDETNGWTALMYAAYNKHSQTMKHLIDGGADIYAKSKTGYSVLDLMNSLDTSDKHITEALTIKMIESSSVGLNLKSPRRSQRFTRTKDWIDNTTSKFGTILSRSSIRKSHSQSVPVITITDSVADDDVFDSADSSTLNNNIPAFHLSLPTTRTPENYLAEELKKHTLELITSSLVRKQTFETESAILMSENNRYTSKNQKRSVPSLSATHLLKDYMKNEMPKTLTRISKDWLQADFTDYEKERILHSQGKHSHFQFSKPLPFFPELQLKNDGDNSSGKDKLKNPDSVSDLLRGKSLEKHIDKFKQQEIDMKAVKFLNKEDLLEMGIDSTLSHEAFYNILRNLQRTSDV